MTGQNQQTEHSPEPWTILEFNGCIKILDWDGNAIPAGRYDVNLTMADARRIVACVNACRGIGTRWLETIARRDDHPLSNRLFLHAEEELSTDESVS